MTDLQSGKLIHVKGTVNRRQLNFMIDSGATSNFLSLSQLRTLRLDLEDRATNTVRLADNQTLQTCGQATLEIHFNKTLKYRGLFQVLKEDVPLILGMQFLATFAPDVDFANRQVTKTVDGVTHTLEVWDFPGTKSIPRVTHALEVWDLPGTKGIPREATTQEQMECTNEFAGLPEEVADELVTRVPDLSVVQPQEHEGVATPTSSKHGTQKRPKKKRKASSPRHPKKKHKRRERGAQQGPDSGSSYLGSDVADRTPCSDDAQEKVEICTLKQFIRGGKKKQYEYFGVITMEQDTNGELQVGDKFALNYIHRSAHGGDGDTEGTTGHNENTAKQQLEILKQKYPTVFEEPVYPVDRSSCPNQFIFDMPLKDEQLEPPKKKIYPLDNVELTELKQQIQTFLDSGRIQPSNSPYGAPILFARKKGGSLRMCIDYRLLNQQLRGDSFPLPRIDELLQRLDGAVVFSKLDLRDGYHQIPVKKEDQLKTAFSCRYGTYQFTVMPFGLSTAPPTFQRMMNTIFFDLLDQGVLCYLDDLLLYSRTIQEHKQLLDKVFATLQKYKLYIKESKCHLFLEKVNFLGHVISRDGVTMETGKLDAVTNWPTPENVTQVQQFLGLCNYYRRFVLRFSEIAGPLTKLTRKGITFAWTNEQDNAFSTLKQCLCSAPVLKIFDPKLKTRVVTDASNFCVGAVLEQEHQGAWHPVEYYSKRLSSAERNYSATDREFVAIKLSLDRWRHLLMGIQFEILTDHAALTYLQSSAHVNRRNARWLDFLSQFTFTISHIKGKANIVADSLSRIPGSEVLTQLELCGHTSTLNILHVDEEKHTEVSDIDTNIHQLSGIISINERVTFRKQLMDEQCAAGNNEWYQALVQKANTGNEQFQFRNGLLCKLVGEHFCPVIPSPDSSTVQVILADLHESSLGGHLGRKKLLASAQARFYWKNMFHTVDHFCRKCTVCQANKGSTTKPKGHLQPLENPNKPFEHISMDFVMSLPVSTRGYDAVFTIVDRFSRLVRFIPCNTTITAQEAATLMFEHWVCRFGVPTKIISDRDARFQSTFWKSLCNALGSRLAMSTSYHPQTDGLTERYHRSVEQVLRCYCSHQQTNWCSYLSQCEFALNSTVSESHQSSPFNVVHGFNPSMPIDTQLDLPNPHAQDVVLTRKQVQDQVAGELIKSRARMTDSANRRRDASDFQPGQSVWLATEHLPLRIGTRKLAAKFTGPFTIAARVTREAFRLTLPQTWRIHDVFHSSQLKQYNGDADQPTQPQPLLVEGEEEYEVAKIVHSRVTPRGIEYLVRWKGFSAWDDTWEPASNLQHAQERISEFEKSRRQRQK